MISTYMLSCIISKISQNTGQIFAVNRGASDDCTCSKEPPDLRPQNLMLRNEKHSSIVQCIMYFDILNSLVVTHKCDRQTDRQTERQAASKVHNVKCCAQLHSTTKNCSLLNVAIIFSTLCSQ